MSNHRAPGYYGGTHLGSEYTAEETAVLKAAIAYRARHHLKCLSVTDCLRMLKELGYARPEGHDQHG